MLRAALLTSLAVLLLGAASTTAQAQDDGPHQVFSRLGCGTPHYAAEFTLGAGTSHLSLEVEHTPGRWGQMTITNSSGTEVWSFRQSYAWIWGSYKIRSAHLPAGTYVVQYWSDNLAQSSAFCRGTLTAEE